MQKTGFKMSSFINGWLRGWIWEKENSNKDDGKMSPFMKENSVQAHIGESPESQTHPFFQAPESGESTAPARSSSGAIVSADEEAQLRTEVCGARSQRAQQEKGPDWRLTRNGEPA